MLAVMQAAFALEVGNLKTQAYRNPIGIDVATPYFGWILASDERGVVQESYEIRVATDRDFQNVVWQSGKVSSSQSVDVLAQGFTTSPRTRYYWQVTVTDNKGNEATSTERAYFETGVGNDPVWSSARWIKVGGNATGDGGEETEITDYEVEVKFDICALAAGVIFAAKDHNDYYMWQVNTLTGSPRFRPHRWTNGVPRRAVPRSTSCRQVFPGVVWPGRRASSVAPSPPVSVSTGGLSHVPPS